jgi:hypothetical protein
MKDRCLFVRCLVLERGSETYKEKARQMPTRKNIFVTVRLNMVAWPNIPTILDTSVMALFTSLVHHNI